MQGDPGVFTKGTNCAEIVHIQIMVIWVVISVGKIGLQIQPVLITLFYTY
jgi:hypothetical protein